MKEIKSVWDYVESPSIAGLIRSTGYFLSFIILLFMASRFLPSVKAKSPKKIYDLTGFLIFIGLTIFIPIGYYTGSISLLFIVQNYISLFIVINIFSILFSWYLFARKDAVKHAPKANRPIDFWNGREQDPMLFGVDLKIYFYQPGLLGLWLINISLAEAQATLYGGVKFEMILYNIFWYIYLFTHYVREDFMLWTFDIIEDHFGFMLVWGDLIYISYVYSIAGWFMCDNYHISLSTTWMFAVILIHIIGHYVFRVSNWQKYDVRKDGPNHKIWGEKAKLLEGKLLISGFWGIGRHLNYTGEILVYLSIAMCAGTTSLVPYILPFSLLILLSQRASRDDKRCRAKYGEVWTKYCKIAKFRMIPFIY